MDPLTQGLLGAAVAQAGARRDETRVAGALGGLAGMAADLDVLIQSSSDPLLFLEVHRQFTHSLLFVPVGALVCAAVLFPFVRRATTFGRAAVFCLLGYATHGLLDACTSYGTQLLWPFSGLRVAWGVVSVVDPLVTVPLLALVAAAAVRRRPAFARIGCAWVLVYLSLGFVQRERAEAHGERTASARGHVVAGEVVAKPAFGNLLLWKTIYDSGGRYHVDAVRLGAAERSFPGESAPKLDVRRDLPWLRPGSRQAVDLERFRRFSGGYLAIDPDRDDHVIDVRYSMLPNEIEALWGIRLEREAPRDAPATFYTERRPAPETRAELLRMLFD